MLLGITERGTDPLIVGASTLYGLSFDYEGEPVCFSKLTAYLDGLGGSTQQDVTMGLYAGSVLLGASEPVTISPADGVAWVDFLIPALSGVVLQPGVTYTLALWGGISGSCARILAVLPGALGSVFTADTSGDEGLPANLAVLGSLTPITDGLPFFATVFAPWTAPVGDDVDDMYLGRLAFELSQRAFGASMTIPRLSPSLVSGLVCGWHDTNFDVETGAFAIARSDGAAQDLVGERILVVRRQGVYVKTAAVYCYAQRPFPTGIVEDISLTRRSFLAISGLEQDSVVVDALPLP